jgi:hypothetical protein
MRTIAWPDNKWKRAGLPLDPISDSAGEVKVIAPVRRLEPEMFR